jgi:hypothetical protein
LLHTPVLSSWCVGDYCAIDPDGSNPTAKKKKKKGSLGESFAVIRSSPKVGLLGAASPVFCFGGQPPWQLLRFDLP